MEVVEEPKPPVNPEPPRGIYPARVDEKGRLKLPSAFQQYLNELGERRVFITSLEMRTVRVYPLSVWKANENFFEAYGEDPETTEDVSLIADDTGADSEMDAQGRLLLPSELRRNMGMENQPVWLQYYKGRINVYSKTDYEDRKRRALENIESKVRMLEKKGLR